MKTIEMYHFDLIQRRLIAIFSVALVLIGCARETLKPTFPAHSGLQRPDRVLVHDFVVTAPDLDRPGVVGSALERPAAQTEEDIRVGRMLAKALSENIINELRRFRIEASPAAEALRPGTTTVAIRGQFESTGTGQRAGTGFTLSGKELRSRIQVLQGSGLNLRVVAESEYTMPSSLRPGLSSEMLTKAVNADASHAAATLADRIADYYRRQGWLE